MRILIGEISSYKAIVIARHIRHHYRDVEIWAYDYKPLVNILHTKYVDHYVRLQNDSIDNYINNLSQYVNNNHIDVFIPVHSDYIGLILKQKSLFNHALDYMGDYNDYIRLHEKDQLMQLARSIGIRVPQEYTSIAEAVTPFVIKPTDKSSAKGVRYCMDEVEKHAYTSLPAHTICQEYIYGQGCGYEVYCKNGQILVEYGHKRLAEWPISGGSSVLREAYMHTDMRPIAEKILQKVKWSGYAMFEFKLTPNNELVLIEVNPRIWGSINQALQDKCPLFAPLLKREIPSYTSQKGVRTCLKPQILLAALGYGLRGNWTIWRDYWRNYKKTFGDVSPWDDPCGWISMIIRKIV